jgi:hypothetical protein
MAKNKKNHKTKHYKLKEESSYFEVSNGIIKKVHKSNTHFISSSKDESKQEPKLESEAKYRFAYIYDIRDNRFIEGKVIDTQTLADETLKIYEIDALECGRSVLSNNNYKRFSSGYSFLTSLFSTSKEDDKSGFKIFYCFLKLGDIFLNEYKNQIKDIKSQIGTALELLVNAYKYYAYALVKIVDDKSIITIMKEALADSQLTEDKKALTISSVINLKEISLQTLINECKEIIETKEEIAFNLRKAFYNVLILSLRSLTEIQLLCVKHELGDRDANVAASKAALIKKFYFEKEFPHKIEQVELKRREEREKKILKEREEKEELAQKLGQELIKAEEEKQTKIKQKNKQTANESNIVNSLQPEIEESKDEPSVVLSTQEPIKTVQKPSLVREVIFKARELLKPAQYELASQEFLKAKKIAKHIDDKLDALIGIADSNKSLAEQKLNEARILEPIFQQELLKEAQDKLSKSIKSYKELILSMQNNNSLYKMEGATYDSKDIVEIIYSNIDSCDREIVNIKNMITCNIDLLKKSKIRYEEKREIKYIEFGLEYKKAELFAQGKAFIYPYGWERAKLLALLEEKFGISKPEVIEAGKYVWQHRYDHLPNEVRLEIMSNSKVANIRKALEFYEKLKNLNKSIQHDIGTIKENIITVKTNEAIELTVKESLLPADNIKRDIKDSGEFKSVTQTIDKLDKDESFTTHEIFSSSSAFETTGDTNLLGDSITPVI